MKTIRAIICVALIICLLFTAAACDSAGQDGNPDNTPAAGTDNDPNNTPAPDDEAFVYEEKYIEVPSLKDVLKDIGSFGVGIDYNEIDLYDSMLIKHVNSVTPGNSMKPESTQPKEGVFKFENADKLVDFALANGMEIHGHTLVWHSQTPSWFFQEGGKPVSRETALKRLKEHIFTVMGHYKGKVKEWDVVNEPVSENGPSILREDSPWYKAIGEDYVKQALLFAHEADPDAKLFVNDFNVEVTGKRERFYNLIKQLLDEGVPIDGIGIQGHWQMGWPSYQDIRDTLKLYSTLGLEIQITELDISVYAWGDNKVYSELTPDLAKLQADRYQKLFEIFNEYSNVISKVSTWGIADDTTWLDNFPVRGRKNWPLLFDISHKPKESFWRIVKEPVLSGIQTDTGTFSKPFDSGALTYLLRVDEGTEQVQIKPVKNDLKVEVKVENAERKGDFYIVDVNKEAPQAKITVTGYGKTNTYELYIQESRSEIIAGWEFDEGAGTTTKDSAKGADADIGSLGWADGINGKALKFAEGQDIDLGFGKNNVFGSSNFSASYWVKPGELKHNMMVLWYGQPFNMKNTLWRSSISSDGSAYFQVQMPVDQETLKGSQFISTDPGLVKPGEWSHIVCVRNGDTLQIYVNGVLKAERKYKYTVDIGGSLEPLLAGKDKDGRGNDYAGLLDSVRIYNYALTSDDVKTLFQEFVATDN